MTSLVWITPKADEMIAQMARVSNPNNEHNTDTAPRLISYLVRHKHWSPFEMASMCVQIETTRDIGRQLLRHRSFAFQEFCVAGNTEVTFELPHKAAVGKRSAYKVTIEKLYRTFSAGHTIPSVIRVYDEAARQFSTSRVLSVFQTGIKPTFRMTLENGKAIECTKEHKFLTASGFCRLEDAIGLEMVGCRAVMTNPDAKLACNGAAAYTDREWLAAAKARSIVEQTGLAGIAAEAGCSTHTVRKWLRKYELQFAKVEVASYSPIWNKGKSGYSLQPHSMATIKKMRCSAKRGEASNLWRGGGSNRSERAKIADWFTARRSDFLKAARYTCTSCQVVGGKLELHHMEPVSMRPDLAYEDSNIAVLCRDCHRAIHNLRGDAKVWRDRSRGHTLTTHWSKVRSIEYVGEQMTYDLEVEHGSHNYIGNGIVVHNSQRYAATDVLPPAPLREARMQDPKNRQASLPCEDDFINKWWRKQQENLLRDTKQTYEAALSWGIAKEVARTILPEGLTTTKMYMVGSIRSWLHLCQVRRGVETQKETRDIADECWEILKKECPNIINAVELSY
jgi:thymidylate synthase (FAD)